MTPLETSLAALKVTITAVHMGSRTVEKWEHDAWRVTIRHDGRTFETDYKSGTGHRSKSGTPRTPKVGDVVGCLLSDASSGDSPFAEWCADMSFDTDSRKALAMYLQCQDTRAALRKLFTPAIFEELAGLEH